MTSYPKPKKLSFREMWKLYMILQKGIKPVQETYLIDEIDSILENIDKEAYVKSLHLLYRDMDESSISPIDSLSMFIDGLTLNNFFDFAVFAEELVNDNPRR